MKYIDKYEILIIEYWHIGAIIFSLTAFMILFMKANRTMALKAFFYLQATMVLWMIAKVFKTVSPTIELRWSFVILQYLAICLLEVAFLEFGYVYFTGKKINNKIRIALYILPLYQMIVIVTNPYHYLFYTYFDFWGDSFGVLFYVHLAIEYIYIGIGASLCAIRFKRQIQKEKKASQIVLTIGIVAPIIFNLIYVSKVLHRFFVALNIRVVFDITPIVLTWSVILFVYATFKYDFFDLSPMMKHEIIHNISTPIIIKAGGKTVFVNESLKNTFNIKTPETVDDLIKESMIQSSELEKINYVEVNDNYYTYENEYIDSFNNQYEFILVEDVTSYLEKRKLLTEKSAAFENANIKMEQKIELLKKTSRLGALNYVSRELHDIMGHSLVVTIKLLEVATIASEDDENKTKNVIEQAKATYAIGISEMNKINNNSNNETKYSSSQLERDLKIMLKNVDISGLAGNVFVRGNVARLDEKQYDIIKKICTESITNTLKHAEATKILIMIYFEEDSIAISIMDDGKGQEKILKGNGLKGMEDRIKLINGTIAFEATTNEGFNTNVSIPFKRNEQ